jgi:hypothetical protein
VEQSQTKPFEDRCGFFGIEVLVLNGQKRTILWINFALSFTDCAPIVFFKGGKMPIQQLIYIIAVVAGIIVLIKPEYLKHIVGGFLIAFGVLGLFTIARARIHIQNLIYILAIVAGIVIFIKPQYMKYIVAGFLIAFGVLGLI